VSVLVPTYRRPALLRRALESALAQDLLPLEVIVGDDAGDAQPVVEAVADPRVRYLGAGECAGLPANLTRLCDAARGELAVVLNDDDALDRRFLAACVERFTADPGLGVVFTNHHIDDGDDVSTRETLLPAGRYDDFEVELARHNPVPISAALFRMDAWREVGSLPDSGACDFVLWARIAALGWPFHYVDEPLMTYTSHGAGMSARTEYSGDVITALEAVSFKSPEAERLRTRRLRDALLTRASRAIAGGDLDGARADIGRAERMAGAGFRSRLLRAAAAHGSLAGVATRAARRVPWRPWP
jgi:glycosyltransferase involved in cell wall biosynthesis